MYITADRAYTAIRLSSENRNAPRVLEIPDAPISSDIVMDTENARR